MAQKISTIGELEEVIEQVRVGRIRRKNMAQKISTIGELEDVIEQGPYAWPGGYPIYFIAEDGEPLAFSSVVDNLDEVRAAEPEDDDARSPDPQWWPRFAEVNWEDPDLRCSHTGERIESAYAEPED